MYRVLVLLSFVFSIASFAQTVAPTSAPDSPQRQDATRQGALTTTPPDLALDEIGFRSYTDFNGSTNDTGHMFTTGFSLGYQFNEHVSVDGRVPFYYLSSSTTATDSTGAAQSATSTENGIGDPSFALLLRLPNRMLDLRTRLTTWVPVADINSGFSTGSVLVDWTSQFSRAAGRLLPYGQIGIANTVPETPLFLLPYTAEGLNARFETGTHVFLSKMVSTGASFYYVLPSGSQTLYSREYHGANMSSGGMSGSLGASGSGQGGSNGYGSGNGSGNESGTGGGGGSGGGNRFAFMTQQVTKGNDITRDYGFSTWLSANLPYSIDAQFGFNRSFDYDLNTFSFGLGFDPIRAFRHRRD